MLDTEPPLPGFALPHVLFSEDTQANWANYPIGRLTDAEEDQLRAAIIFAGAGLDSSLKQLLRDATWDVIHVDAAAERKLSDFTVRFLSAGEPGVSPKRLARILLAEGPVLPRETIVEEYVYDLTGDSLQSVDQVSSTCGALGIAKSTLRKRLKAGSDLDKMFRARNQITHELDLRRGSKSGPGVRTKQTRTIKDAKNWSGEALSVAQEMIHCVAEKLRESPS